MCRSSPPNHNFSDTTSLSSNENQSSQQTEETRQDWLSPIVSREGTAKERNFFLLNAASDSGEVQSSWHSDRSGHRYQHHCGEDYQLDHRHDSSLSASFSPARMSSVTGMSIADATVQPIDYANGSSLQSSAHRHLGERRYSGVQENKENETALEVPRDGPAMGESYPSIPPIFISTTGTISPFFFIQPDTRAFAEPMDTSPPTPNLDCTDDELSSSDDMMSVATDQIFADPMEDVIPLDWDFTGDDAMMDDMDLVADMTLCEHSPMPGLCLDLPAGANKDLSQAAEQSSITDQASFPSFPRSLLMSPLPWSAARSGFCFSPSVPSVFSPALTDTITAPHETSGLGETAWDTFPFTDAHGAKDADLVPAWQGLQDVDIWSKNDILDDDDVIHVTEPVIKTPDHDDNDFAMADMDSVATRNSIDLLQSKIGHLEVACTTESADSKGQEEETKQQSPKTSDVVFVSRGTQTDPIQHEKLAIEANEVKPDQAFFATASVPSETDTIHSMVGPDLNHAELQQEIEVLLKEEQDAIDRTTDMTAHTSTREEEVELPQAPERQQVPAVGDHGLLLSQQDEEGFQSLISRLAGDITDMVDGLARYSKPLDDFFVHHAASSAEHDDESKSSLFTFPSLIAPEEVSSILTRHGGFS